jgi:hypothetical protein
MSFAVDEQLNFTPKRTYMSAHSAPTNGRVSKRV